MSNAYADTVSDIDQAQTLGGGKYLFGKKKKFPMPFLKANDRNKLLTDINLTRKNPLHKILHNKILEISRY